MRVLVVLWLGAALFAGRSSDDGRADGPDPADVVYEAPYGPGAEVGVAYDYSLYVHCGVEWARVDGVWWRTEPLNDGNANPPDGWANPYHRGELTLRQPGWPTSPGPTAQSSSKGPRWPIRRTSATEPERPAEHRCSKRGARRPPEVPRGVERVQLAFSGVQARKKRAGNADARGNLIEPDVGDSIARHPPARSHSSRFGDIRHTR